MLKSMFYVNIVNFDSRLSNERVSQDMVMEGWEAKKFLEVF